MKGIAIGLSNTSKEILKRLKKTEFIDEIYIASSKYEINSEEHKIALAKPKELLQEKWGKFDLIIFIGSIGASVRLINSFLTSKDNDPGVIVIDKKGSKIIPLVGLHQSDMQNIAYQISSFFGGQMIETNNSCDQNFLNIDSFGNQWGWQRSGEIKDWSKF